MSAGPTIDSGPGVLVDPVTGTAFTISNTGVLSVNGMTGAVNVTAGPTGPQGAPGPAGPAGPQGAPGPMPSPVVNALQSGNGVAISQPSGDVLVSAPIGNNSPLLSIFQGPGGTTIDGNPAAAGSGYLPANGVQLGAGFTAVWNDEPDTGSFLYVVTARLINTSGGAVSAQIALSTNSTAFVWAGAIIGGQAIVAPNGEANVTLVATGVLNNQILFFGGVGVPAGVVYMAGGGGAAGAIQSGFVSLRLS